MILIAIIALLPAFPVSQDIILQEPVVIPAHKIVQLAIQLINVSPALQEITYYKNFAILVLITAVLVKIKIHVRNPLLL